MKGYPFMSDLFDILGVPPDKEGLWWYMHPGEPPAPVTVYWRSGVLMATVPTGDKATVCDTAVVNLPADRWRGPCAYHPFYGQLIDMLDRRPITQLPALLSHVVRRVAQRKVFQHERDLLACILRALNQPDLPPVAGLDDPAPTPVRETIVAERPQHDA